MASYVGSGAKYPGHQAGDRQIHIHAFPMQAASLTQDRNIGELVWGRLFEALRNMRREREGAAVGQLYDHAIELTVVSGRCCTWLGF
jgi:hypothetical protein